MRFNFAPITGWWGDRTSFRGSEAVGQSFRPELGKRLRRPLMLAVPIIVAAFGASLYLAQ